MIKAKTSDILKVSAALTKLSGRPLPIKTSYSISKALTAVNSEIKIYDKERIKLLEKHGTLNEDKTEYIFDTPEKEQAFYKELEELLDVEVEINAHPVKLTEDCKIPISAQDIIDLGDFIEVVFDD